MLNKLSPSSEKILETLNSNSIVTPRQLAVILNMPQDHIIASL